MNYFLCIIYLLFSVSGLIFMKLGSNQSLNYFTIPFIQFRITWISVFKLINIIPIQTKITPTIFVLFNVSLKIKNAAKSTITFTNPPNTGTITLNSNLDIIMV